MARRKIVVNPDEMDADITDCPFACQDNYCGIANGGAAVSCKILEDRFSCPLNAGPVEVSLAATAEQPEKAKLFYVQKSDLSFDGLIHFWTKDDHGYAPDISAARVFALEEVNSMYSIQDKEKIAWPKEYIDAKAVDNKVASKDCDIEASHKVTTAASN